MGFYDDISRAYIADLRVVRDEVLAWWQGLLEAAAVDGDLGAAERAVRPRWPAGPVSHPRVIAVYRYYFLLIDALNDRLEASREELPEDDRDRGWGDEDEEKEDGILEPRFILLDNLESKDPEIAEFMSRFVFSPIGANPDDETA
jgi:hypothetical protein